ncbi:FAD/NAD(P)-binding protein [Tamlana sp. I1]|uniref:FAD/NAD(P)-binding protein n=1 Tax=Tamlana sp. I1 TaxID=2762061 RepID=UPI00188FF249|nr:FAD/NAD(P)-binding protein [Tamlana sp. I1]
MKKETNLTDISFIGSGISTSFTLLYFLEKLKQTKDVESKISINIIEKHTEFNVGIPYGSRSGFSTLLITSLKNFLIESELELFINWLNKNKIWLLEAFKKEGGILSKKWLVKNQEAIENNKWEDLYIPRRFFGCYINFRVNNIIDELSKNGIIQVSFISSEVIDINKNGLFYKIHLKDNSIISSKKVVLSVGSLPITHLCKNTDVIEKNNFLLVNNTYNPDLLSNLNKIRTFIDNRSNERTNILIVGANASALELIYKINDRPQKEENKTHFTFISTNGKIPGSFIDEEKQKIFLPKHLISLKSHNNLTAKEIAEATFKDLDNADEINLNPASTVEIISKSFGELLAHLDLKELEIFACEYGNLIGKRQRCAGSHYTSVIDDLEKQKRFEHISGRFKDITNEHHKLIYKDTLTKEDKVHNTQFHIVINCAGGKTLEDQSIPDLHKNLIDKKYCVPNKSKIGFHVNQSLEASENLHIMGPMLAGNIIENKAVWHVEHCGRIIWLSKIMSEILFKHFYSKRFVCN